MTMTSQSVPGIVDDVRGRKRIDMQVGRGLAVIPEGATGKEVERAMGLEPTTFSLGS